MRLDEKLAVASSRSQEMLVGTAAAAGEGLDAWAEPAAGKAAGPVDGRCGVIPGKGGTTNTVENWVAVR
jgi:hypothetical protein